MQLYIKNPPHVGAKLSTRNNHRIMSLQYSTPLQSFTGGVGLAFPVHELLILNGSVLGVSGFVHRAVRGDKEAVLSVVGLLLGGLSVQLVERSGPELPTGGLVATVIAGVLTGLGTKVCTDRPHPPDYD